MHGHAVCRLPVRRQGLLLNEAFQKMMKQRKSTMKNTRRLAVCAVLCALAVALMGVGVIIEIMDLTAAAMAALVLMPILLTYGSKYAILSYAVTGVLGVILMPQSLSAWLFLGLVGYYPILKTRLDRLPRMVAYLIKLLLVGGALMLYLGAFYFLFMGGQGSFWDAFVHGFGEPDGSVWLSCVLVGLSVFTFVIFDLLIDRLLILYTLKWKKQFDQWMK